MRIGQLLWTQCPPLGPQNAMQSVSVEHSGAFLQATGVRSFVPGPPGSASGMSVMTAADPLDTMTSLLEAAVGPLIEAVTLTRTRTINPIQTRWNARCGRFMESS
jgi:hypothetical protein